MNIFNNIFVMLSVFSSIYVIVLIFIAPFIDHLFTSLEDDKLIKETNLQILIEIILHVIILTIAWYWLHKSLRSFLEGLLKIKIKEATQTAIDFISALALIGLQKNLIDKLEYITIEHPFRIAELYS